MGDLLLANPALLAAWGVKVRGNIRSRQTCPVCGRQGKFKKLEGAPVLICQCGQFPATKLEISINWHDHHVRITHDENGRRLSDYVHAERALGLINNQIENKTFNPEEWRSARSNKFLWQNYLADYLQRESNRSKKASYKKKSIIAKHLTWFNNRNIKEIRTADIQDFTLLPCFNIGFSQKFRKDVIEELRHIFMDAYNREVINRVPTFPTIHVPTRAKKWLTVSAQLEIMDKMPEDDRPLFWFMMQYAVRPGEACALCWDCIDIDNRTLVLARTMSMNALGSTPKSRSDRALPIMGWFEEFIKSVSPETARWNIAKSRQNVKNGLDPLPVFVNPNAVASKNPNRFYTTSLVGYRWREARAAAGYPDVQLKNATRHSAGFRFLYEGYDMGFISAFLGHSDERTTRKAYADYDAEIIRRRLESAPVAELPPKGQIRDN